MDRGKLKNIILMLLLLLNLAFAVILFLDEKEAYTGRKNARENFAAVLGERGISLADGVKLDQEIPESCALRRDMDAEQRMISGILGQTRREDQGGNVFVYTGEQGQASFRGTGEFELSLESGALSLDSRQQAALRALEKKLQMEFSGGEPYIISETEDEKVLELCCAYRGHTVYNCKVQLVMDSGGSLRLAMGQRIFDAAAQTAQRAQLDIMSAVLRLADTAGSGAFREITAVEAGYTMTVSLSGECILTPVWQIETDAGTWWVNAETGKLEIISE